MDDTVVADDGCRLWTARSGAGHPVVLCHGGPGWYDTLGDLAALLDDVAAVHRWDQRGCGRSQRRGPYSIARSVADLDAVRAHHGLARTALLGHSWGAELALRYTLADPDRVSGLVYVSGTGIDPDSTWHAGYERNLRDRLGRHLERWQALRRLDHRSPAEERELSVLQLSADYADRGAAMRQAERQATPFLGVNHECNRAINAERRGQGGQLRQACQALQVPTLIVDGAEDIRPRHATDSLARALPRVRRVAVDGAGHLPWVEDPAAVRAAVAGFLAEG
jgi:proline iminopeptidase